MSTEQAQRFYTMKLLFVHRSFPGQFRWILPELSKKGFEIKFICVEKTDWPDQGIAILKVKTQGANSLEKIGLDFSDAALQGATHLQRNGFEPDVIISHYGYGLWRCQSVFPKAKLITYCEWMFNDANREIHSWNTSNEFIESDKSIINNLTSDAFTMGILKSDVAICPTHWQKRSFSTKLQEKLTVIEDGFPTNIFKPDMQRTFDDNTLELLYISRGFEYTRGVDRVLKLIEQLNNECPPDSFKLTILSDNRCVYDEKELWEANSANIRNRLKQFPNVEFRDQLPYNEYINQIKMSDIHLYLSRPFVLSWSFIESSLMGSYILSLNNKSTVEVSHSNHIDFKDIKSMCSMIKSFATSKHNLQRLRSSKFNWINTDEYDIYRTSHSLSRQINDYLAIFI